MKVMHLSCVGPPQTGGIGRVAFEEVERLKARGVEAELLTPKNVPSISFGNAAMIDARELERRMTEIVHLHYPFYGMAGVVARLRRRGAIKHLVMTLHMDATAGGLKGVVFDLHRRWFQKKILDSADALLVSSKDYAAHSSFAPWMDRAIELPFGVDETHFAPGAGDRSSFGMPATAPTVVFVGGMDRAHAFKGVEVLLRALVEVPKVHVLLVGDGELRRGYEVLARDVKLADRAHFVGKLSHDRLPDAYRAGDVLAFPSTSQAEAFGLVALEAQACGIPVVASNLPGVRTVVQDGVTGLLTKVGDAQELATNLRRLLDDRSMRDSMGRAARQRVLDRFTWSRHIDGLIEVYQKICASRS